MQFGWFDYLLLIGLAMALVVAAVTDLKRREIDDWLTAAVTLCAPLYWLASHAGASQALAHLALAGAMLVLLGAAFAAGMMGGGDVKLLAALALWFEPVAFVGVVAVTSVAGGVLTLGCLIVHKIACRPGRPEVPYGVAIAGAGLWALSSQHFPAIWPGLWPGLG